MPEQVSRNYFQENHKIQYFAIDPEKVLVTQSCPTLCNSMDCSSPGSSLSVGFSRQGYCSGLLSPSPGDLPNPGIEPRSPALQPDSLPIDLPGNILRFIFLLVIVHI